MYYCLIRGGKCGSTAKGYIENKIVFQRWERNPGIRCNEPQQQVLSSGTYWRAAAAAKTPVRATDRNDAAELHGTDIQIHARTSYSSVRYNYNISGPATLLRNHTRCLPKKRWNNNRTHENNSKALRGLNLRPLSLRVCKQLLTTRVLTC